MGERWVGTGRQKKNNPEPTLTLFRLASAAQRCGHSLKTSRKVLKKKKKNVNAFEKSHGWKVAETSPNSQKGWLRPPEELHAVVRRGKLSPAVVSNRSWRSGGSVENAPKPCPSLGFQVGLNVSPSILHAGVLTPRVVGLEAGPSGGDYVVNGVGAPTGRGQGAG